MARSKSGQKRRRTQIRQRQRRREKRRKARLKEQIGKSPEPQEKVYFSDLSASTHPDNRCPHCDQRTGHRSETVHTQDAGDQRLFRCQNCQKLFKPYIEEVYYKNLLEAGFTDCCPHCYSRSGNQTVSIDTKDQGRQRLFRCGNSECGRLFKPRPSY